MVVAVAALGLVGCSDSVGSDDGRDPIPTLNCVNPIDIMDEPPDGWYTVVDVVAFQDVDSHQLGRFDAETGRRFSKFGLVLRADAAFVLKVAEASRPNAVLDWHTLEEADPSTAIAIDGCAGVCEFELQPGCPLGETGEWVVYPGGVWTVEPACIELEITTDRASETVRLPIGVTCV